MEQYTIYCTAKQTKKALKLDAPIDESIDYHTDGHLVTMGYMLNGKVNEKNLDGFGWANTLRIPTAEQMIGWLEGQGIALDIHTYFSVGNGRIHHYQFTVTDSTRVFNGEYSSRKEATLAAIDAALDYLIENRK